MRERGGYTGGERRERTKEEKGGQSRTEDDRGGQRRREDRGGHMIEEKR